MKPQSKCQIDVVSLATDGDITDVPYIQCDRVTTMQACVNRQPEFALILVLQTFQEH